jgi:hypothetical protein
MVMLFTGCAMADENNAKEDNVQYKVTPVKIKEVFEDGVIDVKTSSGTISQGETNWHSEYIGYYTKKLYINLDWGDTSDSLKLTIYTPDDQILGPYYIVLMAGLMVKYTCKFTVQVVFLLEHGITVFMDKVYQERKHILSDNEKQTNNRCRNHPAPTFRNNYISLCCIR